MRSASVALASIGAFVAAVAFAVVAAAQGSDPRVRLWVEAVHVDRPDTVRSPCFLPPCEDPRWGEFPGRLPRIGALVRALRGTNLEILARAAPGPPSRRRVFGRDAPLVTPPIVLRPDTRLEIVLYDRHRETDWAQLGDAELRAVMARPNQRMVVYSRRSARIRVRVQRLDPI